jgi:hypothetical protein
MQSLLPRPKAGTPTADMPQAGTPQAGMPPAGRQTPPNPHPIRRGGFIQTFGLDVRAAALAVIVDVLVFGGSIASLGALYVVELGAGVVLTFITYKIQRTWYGDDHDSALIKALIIGLLTAIPVPVTGLFAGPGGLLGLVQWMRSLASPRRAP